MLFAVIGQCACMAILAGTVWDGGHAAGLVATVMLFLFNFFFGVGLLAIPWLCTFILYYQNQIQDTNTRQCLRNTRRWPLVPDPQHWLRQPTVRLFQLSSMYRANKSRDLYILGGGNHSRQH